MYEINLLPAELRPGLQIDRKRLLVKGILIIVIMGLAGAYCGFIYRFFSLQNELAHINRQMDEILPQTRQVEALRQTRIRTEARLNVFYKLIDHKKQWACVLTGINDVLPVDAWLTGINIHYDPAIIEGDNLFVPEGHFQQEPVPDPEFDRSSESAHAPNAVTIKGNSGSVPSVGVFLNYLKDLNYFQYVRLDTMNENRDEGVISFVITAYTRESEK